MSENLLFTVAPNTQDTSNALLVHENIKISQDEHLVSGATQNVNLNKDIASSLTQDWYQKDLAHMTTNLMKAETNSASTALSTTLSPRLMSRSASFNDTVSGGYYPNNWGSVDLSGLGNFFGTGSWRDRPDVVRAFKADAITDATNIFHSVFNRDPNANELNNAAGSVYGANGETKKLNALQNKLAYSKEGHDRIANIGIDILGYAPSEELIKQEQAKLAKYGTTQKDIRNDFIYSQAAYDKINQVTSTMYGQPVNEATIKWYQANLANGWFQGIQNVKIDFANSQATYDKINQVTSTMYGQPVNEATIKWYQANLANGWFQGIQNVRADFANSQATYDRIKDNVNRILGYDWGGNANNVHWAQSRLANGESMKAVLDSLAYGDETHAIIRDNVNRILGYDWGGNANNVRWAQSRLANGESMKAVLDSLAYGDETHAIIRDNVNRILGYDWGANANNVHWVQGRLANGESMKAALDSLVYGDETYNRIVNMGKDRGLQLTPTVVRAEQDLIKKQGMILTQQQFNQVADNIKIIQKYFPDFRVDDNRFLNYQRMVGDNISPLDLQKFMMQDFVSDNHITNYNGTTFDYSLVPDVPGVPKANVNMRYAIFAARHGPGALLDIGEPSLNGQNISSDAVRFSTAGEEGIDRGGKALGTFQKFDEVATTLKDGTVVMRGPGDGTQVNAARHVLWSAIITSHKGVNIAKEVGDIHETHPNADTTKRIFDKLADADEIVDLLNNSIGRAIGTQYNEPQTAKTLANRMLDEFYRNGLYTVNKIESGENAGKYEVVKTKINIEQYNYMKNEYTKLDDFGFKK